MRQDAPFFQAPQGRKIIVPRADHAIRWAMQPGAPASRNRASAASSSTHPRPLCGLPEKGSPFHFPSEYGSCPETVSTSASSSSER